MIKSVLSFIKNHKYTLGIIGILLIAFFFRFYHLYDLQYYSYDDELYTMLLKRIAVDKKLVLLSPSPKLGISLGSFWHLLSAPILKLSGFDAVKMLSLGSAIGVVTTYLLYFVGKELGGKKVGLIAGFLYASSFLMSLADRRWWQLTFDPFFVTLSILSIIKMVKGRLIYSLPLAICISFAWHADPTLAIIALATLICFFIFRMPVWHKSYLPAIIIILISLSPFLLSEIRHPGSVSYPIQEMLGRFGKPTDASDQVTVPVGDIAIGLAHSLFATPSRSAEEYMYPHTASGGPQINILLQIVSLLLFLFPIYLLFKGNTEQKKPLTILYVFFTSTIIGILITNLVFKFTIYQYYFGVIWPVLFLLAAFTLDYLIKQKPVWMWVGLMSLIFLVNVYALSLSSMRYPLNQKADTANFIASQLSPEPFSLQLLGNDIHLSGGGMGGVLTLQGRFPSNQNYYFFDWFYKAFSLYNVPIVEEAALNQKVFVYPQSYQPDWSSLKISTPSVSYNTGQINVAIYKK